MVRFDAAVDPILLAETLAIERECCDFFDLRYSEAERELEVTVADKRQDPALDAIGESLGIRSG